MNWEFSHENDDNGYHYYELQGVFSAYLSTPIEGDSGFCDLKLKLHHPMATIETDKISFFCKQGENPLELATKTLNNYLQELIQTVNEVTKWTK